MEFWGIPESRRCMDKGDKFVELYTFKDERIARYATVGLSSNHINETQLCNCELLLCVPSEVSGTQSKSIEDYIFDICAYLLETLGRITKYQDLIPENELAPKGWPKAVLFDEPTGEPEKLAYFHVGEQHVILLWVIPIYGTEYVLIKEKGIERFDTAAEMLELSLVDVRRQSCASHS